ncbi:MAG: glutathione peroxidase [Clostridiales Family XIII bacterium]|nr:glutathione peroxidase [Clostridiales Family XIII bacterium]
MSVYDFSYTSIEGEPVNLSDYAGKVLLIVNVASKCGFTPQYKALEELYEKYSSQGFEIIGFPCDQFGGQEPGSKEEIVEFCSIRYGVTFPLSEKVEVRDENAIPLYKYLTDQKGFEGFGKGLKSKALTTMLKAKYKDGFTDEQIKWNFTKFLIDKKGAVVSRFEPPVEPEAIAPDIEELLM